MMKRQFASNGMMRRARRLAEAGEGEAAGAAEGAGEGGGVDWEKRAADSPSRRKQIPILAKRIVG